MALVEQTEELEVLQAIYGEDELFKEISAVSFQYKYGVDGSATSVVLEINWPESYPVIAPKFNLNAFYNNHLSGVAKARILNEITQESEKLVGDVQTYTMIEWVRENFDRLVLQYMPEGAEDAQPSEALDERKRSDLLDSEAKAKVKKEQLTKTQKRKEWEKKDNKGEVVRGTGWVDVVKHLSQTGGHAENE